MTVSARDEVLRRVRAARPTGPVTVPREYRAVDGGADLVELLVDRLVDYKATVRRCTTGELAGALGELLSDASAVVTPAGVPEGWLAGYHGRVLRDGEPRPLAVADLDAPGLAVLTGCAVAVARTGTLILDAGPDQGRRALTLVPDHHVCVVHSGQVVGGVPEALARLTALPGPSASGASAVSTAPGRAGSDPRSEVTRPDRAGFPGRPASGASAVSTAPGRPLTLVSGPSATSDIELNRVEGVHGPRRLDVVVVVD